MALNIFGPPVINVPPATETITQLYTASKPAAWSVVVTGDGALTPADYSVTISGSGLLTVTLMPGVIVPPGTALSLIISASSGPGAGNNGSLNVTVNLPAGVVPCFVAGSLIDTVEGPRPVETLAVGDLVPVEDGPPQPILWIGKRTLSIADLGANPHLRPVRIRRDALGPGCPNRTLWVSPQHRIVLQGWRAELFFGEAQVFAAAIHLTNDDTIRQCRPNRAVTYYHLAFQRHLLLCAHGLLSESIFLGDIAFLALRRSDVEELLVLFPELRSRAGRDASRTRLRCLTGSEARLAGARSGPGRRGQPRAPQSAIT